MVAVREIIANAIVHASYADSDRNVHVALFSHRLEVSSPGKWYSRLMREGKEIALSELLPTRSVKRRVRLAHQLSRIQLVEAEGSGLAAALANSEKGGWCVPRVVESDSFVTVIFRPKGPYEWNNVAGLVVGQMPPIAGSFEDRAEFVGQIFANDFNSGVTLVAAGLGGKTQMAASYAHQSLQAGNLDLLVWITAASRDATLSGYAATAREVGLHLEGRDIEQSAVTFLSWLQRTDRRWLVVLDDVADPRDLDRLWPSGRSGRVLVTTRRRDATLRQRDRVIIEVDVFTHEQACAYLSRTIPSHQAGRY